MDQNKSFCNEAKRIIEINRAVIIFLFSFFIVCLLYLSTRASTIHGDGAEYILQMISFERSFSFGVTKEDVLQAKEEFKDKAEFLESYYNSTGHQYKNAKYFNHNGFYSMLAIPMIKLVTVIGKNPIKGFYILNLLMFMTALLAILLFLNIEIAKKSALILLLAVNPVFFYLDWIHTEVFLYTFVVISLVFYYNNNYIMSILFINIAATQNLAILPLALAVEIHFLINMFNEYKFRHSVFSISLFLKNNYKKILLSFCCYFVGVMPMLSTYLKFQTLNLVADVARENKYLVQKCFGYLFDLNLGIFPYEPIILLTFMVMIFWGIQKLSLNSVVNLIGITGIFYIISNQIQINCGMQNIMRYNVWIIPIMIFYVIINWEIIWKDSRYLISCSLAQAFYTTCIITYIILGSGGFDYKEFAPWTKLIMNNYPCLYNPVHGIFYTRASGMEMYYSDEPIAFRSQDGVIRKILLSKSAELAFYSGKWKLRNNEGRLMDKAILDKVIVDGGDFSYVNIPQDMYLAHSYQLGDIIYFYTDKCNVDSFHIKGLSWKEDWGRWTDGKEMKMIMDIESNKPVLKAHINIESVFYKPQRLIIQVNEKTVLETVVDGKKILTFDFPNPENNIAIIKMLLPDAVRPKDVIKSTDPRMLGLGLRTMAIN